MRVGLALFLGVLTALLAGCGEGTSSTTSTTVPASPIAVAANKSPANVDAVAQVASTPIPRPSYVHWTSVEAALGASGDPSHKALGFLLNAEWVIDEARARGISVPEAEVKQRLLHLEKIGFPEAGAFKKFLAKSGETESDLLARSKVELLRERIAGQITAGKSAAQHGRILAGFERDFKRHWKKYTTCKPGYVMEDCSEYVGPPEVSKSHTPVSSRSFKSKSPAPSKPSKPRSIFPVDPKTGASAIDGEVPPRPAGQLSMSSPAFGLNQPIPTQYTCDGAGTSPPLQWTDVPPNAAALILFVIDDDTRVPHGGIRWMVGDINPHSTGVAAGAVPEGGIVGENSEGHTGYSGVCPAPGTTSRIEFVVYALSKRIPLSPGFSSTVAEGEYGAHHHLIIGEAAVTYAGYQRP